MDFQYPGPEVTCVPHVSVVSIFVSGGDIDVLVAFIVSVC